MGETRSPERLRHHFEVERELGIRLRNSTRAERTTLLGQLYDELFARVPDHPRLTRRETPESSRAAVRARLRLVEPFLSPDSVFLEIAPGDCRLCFEVAPRVREVIGADISDQTGGGDARPANFRLIVWDGFDLGLADGSVDLAFSYQLLEHLHPDDIAGHLATVRKALRAGGRYVVSTPHRYSGPHDISRFFAEEPEGLHLKEWTYGELETAAKAAGFTRLIPFRRGRPRTDPAARLETRGLEWLLGLAPRRLRRALSRRLFQSVSAVLEA
jgi:SAM-dependent methyltransferase